MPLSVLSSGTPHLSGAVLWGLLPVTLILIGIVGYALIDLFRRPRPPLLPRVAWVLVILVSIPWGAVVYLLLIAGRRSAGRDQTQYPPDGGGVPVEQFTVTDPTRAVGAAHTGEGGTTGRDALIHVTTTPAVRTDALTRDYGGAGLFDVDLRVPQGSVYGLVGPNGAGKTTLLSILTGMRRADRGTVEMAVPRRAMAVCPDVPEFEPWLTAYEVVDLARYYVAPDSDGEAVPRALAAAGLSEHAGRRVGGFSRGMTQRLGLAAALVGDPELLLLDEPTSALDPAGRADMLDLVGAMRGRRTVIFSSHILADVQRVADQVGVLRAGRLLYQGPTRTLIDEHLSPSWTLRLGGQVPEVVTALSQQPWVRRVHVLDDERLRVDADAMISGERGIPRVLAGLGARLVACEPRAADLESAFLALTGSPGPR